MAIDRDYLEKELMQFRGIMCSNKVTVEQKDDAFNGLIYAYLHHTIPSEENIEDLMVLFRATSIEWERRRLFKEFHI